jgi:hypothetical protein
MILRSAGFNALHRSGVDVVVAGKEPVEVDKFVFTDVIDAPREEVLPNDVLPNELLDSAIGSLRVAIPAFGGIIMTGWGRGCGFTTTIQ